jgi:hypothetical protein
MHRRLTDFNLTPPLSFTDILYEFVANQTQMDVLRAEAEQLLQDLPIESAESQHEAIHIKSSRTDYANTIFEKKTLNDLELRNFVDCSPPPSDIMSTKIVRMHYHSDDGIKSLPSLFGLVWRSFRLDPYMMYMFNRNLPGFFRIPSSTTGDALLNFYVNCQAYWLLWTFNPSTLSTNAIVISRNSRGGRATYPHLHARLKRYSDLAGHPLFLALITALERIAYIDIFLREQHKRIGRTEEHTGFSHFHIDKPQPLVKDPSEELTQLSNLSRLASSVLVGLSDMVQHLNSSTTVVQALLSFSPIEEKSGSDVMMRKEAEIKNIARVLDPQLKQRFGYLGYIKERAQNQLTVVCILLCVKESAKSPMQIFNLLARGDAQSNIIIARAAMHESMSMKTIAIMTMVFLPATFYAALFSVPSLRWDQPTIIGSRFWIYWAITIPTTILVFVLWFAIDHWGQLWGQVEKSGKRAVRKRKTIAAHHLDGFA